MYNNANRYRDMQVLSASPAQLVVIVYDHLLVNLTRARSALEAGQVEERCIALDRARAALGELLVTLDREKGGSIAANLSGIYTFLIGELSTVRSINDLRRVVSAIGIVSELRDGFIAAAAQAGKIA